MDNKNIELELAKDTMYSIVKQEHKDRVRMKYNNYLCYLQKNGLDFNVTLFGYVDRKYMNYINKGQKEK